ncbi:MAG: HDOD domain-containing protein [Desulfobacterales bacterium]|nr:HDOD domain-containing protein [Desulfobacterales bacterium]
MNKILNLPSETEIRDVLHLDEVKLPSFPQAAAKLLETARDESTSMEELSAIIETDPGLSAQVLKIVNSATYNVGRRVTSLQDAVVMLGLDEIKKQAYGIAIFKGLFKEDKGNGFDRLLFWRHSLAVAVLSMEIAKKMGYINPEEAYIAGLLHDVGKVFLDLRGKKDYGDFIRALSTSTDLVIEKERASLGLGHDDIGAYFCNRWELPRQLAAAVKYHHQSFAHLDIPAEHKCLIAIVSLSDFICWTQGIGSYDFIRPPVLPPEVEGVIDLEKINIIKCITEMNREVDRISAFYRFVFPSDTQLQENLLWANLKLSRLNTQYYYQDEPLNTENAPTPDRYLHTESVFSKALAKAKSVKEVLDILMYQIGRIFKPRNWSILLKDPKTEELVFSVVVGANKDKLKGMRLPKGEGVAGYIAKTGTPLVVADVSADERFSKRVDRVTGFKTRSIIGTPLKTGKKVFGVIQLINRDIEEHFDTKDMDLLSSISEYAAIAIERSYYTQALTNLATKDVPTGLKNRWSFERAVGNASEFKVQYGSVFSMLIVTVDGLENLLMAEGQAVYDNALKEIVRVMNAKKRRDDTLYRYGENIFLMLLPLTYSDGSEKLKRRIEDGIRLSVSKEQLPELAVTIADHTLSSKEVRTFKTLVEAALSETKKVTREDRVAAIEENLQPLVEEEMNKAAEERRGSKFGKVVSLRGHYLHPTIGASVYISVKEISLTKIAFTIPKKSAIKVNDFLDIQFVLDDLKRSVIKRQIIVKEVEGDYVLADFYNPPPYAKNLGFYLIS